MKKLFLFSVFCLAFLFGQSNQAAAQSNYQTALGLRFGPSYGLSLKHFFKQPWAGEFLLSSHGWGNGRWGRGFKLTGLAEWHGAIPKASGLNWYAGLGAHLGFWRGYSGHPVWNENRSYTILGFDGILGLEYTFKGAPFTLALDWKPEFDFLGGTYFWADGIALTVRISLK